jgi:hypothetical protein
MTSSLPSFLVTLVLGIAVMYLLNRVRRQTTMLRGLQKSVDTVKASQLCNDDISELCSGAVRDAQRTWASRNVIIADQSKDGPDRYKEDTKQRSPTFDDSTFSSGGDDLAPSTPEGVDVEESTGSTTIDRGDAPETTPVDAQVGRS